MNAWATRVAGTWLMGECEINDVEVDGAVIGKMQGLHVQRCRFLEESGCVSVCINSCKLPTEAFFLEEMGLPLTMTPNYETFECQFSFGLTPTLEQDLEARNTPCLSRCPTAGSLRRLHSVNQEVEKCKMVG
jgi:Beta-carotene isomerase D27-like, C-terminal